MDIPAGLPLVIAALVGLTSFLFIFTKNFLRKSIPETSVQSEEANGDAQTSERKPSSSVADTKKKPLNVKKPSKASYTDPWLLTSLKAHTGDVTSIDFNSSGKHLASCSEDRTVILWNTKDFDQKEHKHVRGKVDYDFGLHIKWSPDSKALVVYKGTANAIEVYKINKKPDGKLGDFEVAVTFPEKHVQEIVGMGIALTGKYIMSCSADNNLLIWSLKGDVLEQVNLNLATAYFATISPCGRFVVASGFTPDVKVFEVVFSKLGGFEKVVRAFELKGHSSGVYSVAINTDSTKMATVSKDKTWKMFDTNIEYTKGQEPYLLFSVPFDCGGSKGLISMSPDGRSVAIATGPHIHFFSGVTGKFVRKLEHVHEGNIKTLVFDPSNKLLLSCGDKQIRVFHNVVGYMAAIEDLEQKKKTAPHAAMKDRITDQINEAKKFLSSLGEF